MNCPECDVSMVERQRNGVTIDLCTQCQGVWLDPGELESILAPSEHEWETVEDEPRYEDRPHRAGRRSLLHELFD